LKEESALMPLKYADYARKQEDELETEIQEASENSESRQADNSVEIPERFKDKSVEDVIKSYTELEKAYSRQGNDLGEYRKLTEQLLSLESAGGSKQPEQAQSEDISIDALYDDPKGTIEKVVSQRVSGLEQQFQQERFNDRLAQLSQKYDGWQEEVRSPEFTNWVQEWANTPVRQRLVMAGDQGDLDAAEEVLLSYYEKKQMAQQAQKSQRKAQRDADLAKGTLESGSPESPESETTFSRRKLLDLRIKAKQGNRQAINFLKDNQADIARAYAEGRLVD
jgi:allophanate hydrolase subunit 1